MTKIEALRSRGVVPKAALYARFSSDNQREESIEAQFRAIHDYCQRNGIVIVHEYADRARSATTDDRPEFLQMMYDSKCQDFNLLIVHKLDRFSRNRYDSAYYKRELRKSDISLISVLEQLDDSPESIILESVLEGMSEYYSKNLAREVMKGMRESALKCQAVGGRAPFGYMVNSETRKYEIKEDEAEAVRYMFKSVVEGLGYMEIIHNLNAFGYQTRLGNPFGKNSIHEILRNEKYKGIYVFNRSVSKNAQGVRNNHKNKTDDEIIRIPGGMPTIIDEEVFDSVNTVLSGRTRISQHGTAKENYMLAGKILCGECGAHFSGSKRWGGRNKTLQVTYRCTTRKSKGSEICRNKEIRKEYLETFVFNEIEKIVFNDDRIPQFIKSYREYSKSLGGESKNEVVKMKSNLKTIEKKISNIVSVIAETGSSALLQTLNQFEKEKGTVECNIRMATLNHVENEIEEESICIAYNTAKKMYQNGSLVEKKQLLNLYLNKVLVYQNHIEVYLNMVPVYMMTKEIENEKGLTECEPIHNRITLYYEEKRALPSVFDRVEETFRGGGEGS